MNYSNRAYSARKTLENIKKLRNSDDNKQWKIVFTEEETVDDSYNYVIFNI